MSLKDLSRGNLLLRRKLLESIIEEYKDDPRVGEPQRQLRIINAELATRTGPDDITIGLKTLRMTAKRGELSNGSR